jgi:Protein ENHANCED DISEASE RESISTANCE 2, C-terminal
MGVGFRETSQEREEGCWSKIDPSTFKVRAGPNYERNGTKLPSLSALYNPIGYDFLRSETAIIDSVSDRLVMPPPPPFYEASCPLPALLIVCGELPLERPPLFGQIPSDYGVNGVCYFQISEETYNWSKNLATAPPAVRQWHRLLAKGASDRETAFKAIGIVLDFEKHNLPLSSVLKKYNGKPTLLKFPFSKMTRGKLPYDFVQISFDIRKWAWVTRMLVAQLKEKVRGLTIDFACLVEAVKEEDMPERVLGCIRIHGFDWTKAEIIN